MMKEELVSIIVPIYNVEDYLDRCIESIVLQSYRSIQIILIDDGSTDSSSKICDAWKEKDNRIEVVHKENGGLSDARNCGLDCASGQFITFIDSDDFVENDYIEYLYRLIKENNTDISICAYYIDRGDESISKGKGHISCKLEPDIAIKKMLNDEGFSISATSKLYKNEIFKGIRFPIDRLCEDNGTTYKLIMKANSVYYGAQAKYHYIIREGSIMNSFNWKKMDLIDLTDMMAHDVLLEYPYLSDVVTRRQLYARMSVLRQAVTCKNVDYNDKRIVDLRKDILNSGKQLKTNKSLDKRDRMGYMCLRIGIRFFAIAWMIYTKIRKE